MQSVGLAVQSHSLEVHCRVSQRKSIEVNRQGKEERGCGRELTRKELQRHSEEMVRDAEETKRKASIGGGYDLRSIDLRRRLYDTGNNYVGIDGG